MLSFLLLRGRCRACRVAISWQYPLVELLATVLTVLAFGRLVLHGPGELPLQLARFVVYAHF